MKILFILVLFLIFFASLGFCLQAECTSNNAECLNLYELENSAVSTAVPGIKEPLLKHRSYIYCIENLSYNQLIKTIEHPPKII